MEPAEQLAVEIVILMGNLPGLQVGLRETDIGKVNEKRRN